MKASSSIPILHWILLTLVCGVLIWSGIHPKDQVTWLLEVSPVLIGLVLVFYFYRSYRLTNLLYILISIHAVILAVGGKYTYAEVPLGDWVKETFHLARNHYDRLGHLAQGFVPAILAREILIRNKVVLSKKWLFYLVVTICLSFSAFYEFIEWGVALISDEAGTAFLGTQGDIWDTQWDMFLAMIGCLISQITLGRLHDRQLKNV